MTNDVRSHTVTGAFGADLGRFLPIS